MLNLFTVSSLFFAVIVLGVSFTGLAITKLIPWSTDAKNTSVPCAFGFAMAPFLLGIAMIVVLAILPGVNHFIHLSLVGILSIIPSLYIFIGNKKKIIRVQHVVNTFNFWDISFSILLVLFVICLLINTFFLPLLQNDALEYAAVGRVLFKSRDLLSYPVLNNSLYSEGFYGPWTHPPLYVSLIYLTQAIQGHADNPGLMRLIAPWSLLVGTYLIYSMGCTLNRTIGLITALIFISTPLLYLGASGGLIDSLPVLGMTIILCSIIMIQGGTLQRGVIQGIALGFALWTHSQAILFIPLTIVAIFFSYGSVEKFKIFFKQIIIVLIIAILIAIWPYLRNISLYGSFISDNPAVFQFVPLNWPEYFSITRGFNTWLDKIQKGLFKGWTMIEAYAFAFWFMILGIIFYLKNLLSIGNYHIFKNIPSTHRWGIILLSIIICYHCGIVLSIFLGVDLMLRNERYLLILMPCVSLFAGYGIYKLLKQD